MAVKSSSKARKRDEVGTGPAPGSMPGHNRAADPLFPEPTEDPVFVTLAKRRKELLDGGSKWVKLPKIADDEEAEAAAAFAEQARQLKKDAEAARYRLRKPAGDHYDSVTRVFDGIATSAELILKAIKPLREQHMKAKQDALDAEAKRKREEAAAEQARLDALTRTADPTDLAAIDAVREQTEAVEEATKAAELAGKQRAHVGGTIARGDAGTKRSEGLRTVYSYKVADAAKCAAHWAEHPKALELWRSLAGQAHRTDRTWKLDGIEIIEGQAL